MQKRKNYGLLFAILLLALTSLSPNMDLSESDNPLPRNDNQSPSRISSLRQTGEPAALRVAVALDDDGFAELQRISDRYALSKGISVTLENLGPGTDSDALIHELTVGSMPDIVMTDAGQIRELAQGGYLLPADAYQNSPGGTPLTPLLPLLQWNGYTWGVPLDIDPYVFVYEPQVLKSLGMEHVPGSADAWDSLLKAMKPESGKYVLALDKNNPYGLSALLESMGSPLYPAARKALEWVQKNRSAIYSSDGREKTVWSMLKQGHVAIAAMPYSVWREHAGSGEGLTVETPWGADGAEPQTLLSRSFALSAQSRSPEAAADWLSYLTSPEAQTDWLKSTGMLPAASEPYRDEPDVAADLPFDPEALLKEKTQADEPRPAWTTIVSAARELLTGKLDAPGFLAAVSSAAE
ncbi:extracellular solute-binding protein [Paenibacillus sp. HN-1]|uniref:sugar ABC transporter substrate-binding protein n=1 Tax=Paenibacillus TaxID=44249 RepID=UPI001CA9B635|nr:MULTISPECIES: extracellular solute-binding protein [Paenibacillus]MBY9076944.1 extracellular solute-binding protein [Paenibacillus sp. CGMCC 1.18879]MBY9086209.1 extracellular solute-binding protein [Paenibacillus sinensis]